VEVHDYLTEARQKQRHVLSEPASKQILAQYHVAVPKGYVTGTPDETVEAFAMLQPPVVLKVVSPDIVHKSDVGGVKINLNTAQAVRDATTDLAHVVTSHAYRIDGFLIEEMAPTGYEMVVGGVIDPRFGPLIMTGLGGIFVEIFKDVTFRICPITAYDAWEMIQELQAAPLLAGIRGQVVASKEALIEVLLHIGGEHGLLLDLCEDIQELDINPLIITDTCAVAVDARIILAETTHKGAP